MVAAEIHCTDRGIVIPPRRFPITCPFSSGSVIHHCHADLTCRSPAKLGTIFLWLVPPHPPRCAGCSRRGASGVTCGAAPGAPRASLLDTLLLRPRDPTPPAASAAAAAAAAARGSQGPGAEPCPPRSCAHRAVPLATGGCCRDTGAAPAGARPWIAPGRAAVPPRHERGVRGRS